MMGLSPDDRRRELEAMRDVGLEAITIPYLEYRRHRLLPSDDRATGPRREILRFADAHGMRVSLGARAPEGWWHRDAAYPDRTLAGRERLIRTIPARDGGHRSFAGWYFTEGVSGPLSPGRVRPLRGDFRSQSDGGKAPRARPVAFAPSFSHLTTLESMRKIYDPLLDGAGIDVLMRRGGVGARGGDRDLEERIVPPSRRLRAVRDGGPGLRPTAPLGGSGRSRDRLAASVPRARSAGCGAPPAVAAARDGSRTGTALADPTIPNIPGEPDATFVPSPIRAVNDHGNAVGDDGDSTTGQPGLLLDLETGRSTFLDDPSEASHDGVEVTRIPSSSRAACFAASSASHDGVEVTQITAIDHAGEITGFDSDADGVVRAFLATPPMS
jgi:hypothetical protein